MPARAYLRTFAPLTLLSFIVFAPYLWMAWHTPIPPDVAAVRSIVKVAWLSLVYVGCAQLLLVGAVPRTHGLSQRQALATGARQLVRAVVPMAVAIGAIVVGGIALALPGIALLGLFSLTAGSDEPGLPGPLLDSARIVARHWRRAALTLVAIGLADFAIIFACQKLLILSPQIKQAQPRDLAMVARVVRFAALGFAILSPVAACALASIRGATRAAIDSRPDASPAPEAPPEEMSSPPE